MELILVRKLEYLTILGLIFCYLGAIYLPIFLNKLMPVEVHALLLLRYIILQCFLCGVLLYYVKKIEHRSWTSIGFKRFDFRRDVTWGLIGFSLGGVSFAISGAIIAMLDMETTMDGVMNLMKYPIWFRIGIAFVAGITEELLFRTYPIERIKELSGSIWVGAIISIVLFTVLHIPFWSLGGGIQIGIGTIIWTLIYIKTRSIWPMVIMHVSNDLFAFVLLPYLFGM